MPSPTVETMLQRAAAKWLAENPEKVAKPGEYSSSGNPFLTVAELAYFKAERDVAPS